MWSTNSLWFEVAIVSIIYAVGNMVFGHFEERTPKFRRVGKYILTLIIICVISVYLGRAIAMYFLAAFLIPLLYVHGYFLPRKKVLMGGPVNPKANTMISGIGTKTYLKTRENVNLLKAFRILRL